MGHYLTYIFLVFAYKYPHHYYLILCWLLLVDFIFLTFKRLIRFFNTSTGSEAQISTYIIQVDSSHALLLRSPCMPLHEICMFWVLYELLSLLFLCFGFFVVVFLLFLFGGGCYYCCFVFFNNFAFFFCFVPVCLCDWVKPFLSSWTTRLQRRPLHTRCFPSILEYLPVHRFHSELQVIEFSFDFSFHCL